MRVNTLGSRVSFASLLVGLAGVRAKNLVVLGLLFGSAVVTMPVRAAASLPPPFALAMSAAVMTTESAADTPTKVTALDVDELLRRSLDFSSYAAEQRSQFAAQAKLLMPADPEASPQHWAALGLALSYLRYQSGEIEEALEILEPAMSAATLQNNPEIYVRTRSFYAGLLLLSGDNAGGLRRLEELLERDLSQVNPLRVANARVNYASALVRNGSMQKAAGLYEQVLKFGLALGYDMLALSSGSNYVEHLNKQKLYVEANYWLQELEPAMQRLPNIMPVAALKLQKLQVLIHAGQTKDALVGLERYLASAQGGPAAVLGNGYQLYALALLEDGQLAESLSAAEKALQLLDSYPIEKPEAQLVLIRTLLSMGRSEQAGEVLRQVDQTLITSLIGVNTFQELKLQYQLGMTGNDAAMAEYVLYLASNEAMSEFVNARQSDHYGAKLLTARQEAEIALIKDQKTILAAEAKATQAEASELLMRESATRQQRNFLLGLVLLVAAALVAFILVNSNRRLERGLRVREQEQNVLLSKLVDEKSKALVAKVREQSELEQALNERRHMEAIGHLTGNLAHDFNNLLQVVSSANDSLADIAKDSPYQSALQASNKSLAIGGSTIKQLLAYSRRQELEATTVVVADFFRETSALYKSAIGEPYELRIEDATAGRCLRLDVSQLTTALLNLLRNAVDSMSGPGAITVRANCLSPDELTPHWSCDLVCPELVQIQVVDSGCGMTALQVERALEPFYSTKSDATGTGLGLSSVYGFVKQSGGDMHLDSNPGEGTVVTLLFPAQTNSSIVASPTARPSASIEGARVLLVEDNELIAKTLQLILDRIGVQAQWVASTDSAQQRLQDGDQFDFVLSDIRLPGRLDGFGLARWVEAEYPGIPMLLMSGYGQADSENSGRVVLGKPFTQKELVDFITQQVAYT